MAKLIPSGVINLPNFAELQYNLNERERQKQLQFDEWSSQFDKKAGTYLDGDKEAVQQAYSGVEAALKELARDPDNVDLRRKVREANASYNEIAGTAQFLADNYRQQWSAYNTDPDKFSVSGQEAIALFDSERSTKRDANQIMSLASNPFTLNPKYKYDIESPTQVADKALEFIARDIKSFIKEDGTIDNDKVRSYAERYYDTRYIDPAQQKNAIVYEGVRQGVLGRNGEITSRSDLDIIDTEAFKPRGAELQNMFRDDFLNAVIDFAPRVAVDAYTRAKDRQNLSLKRAQLDASKDSGGGFPRLQIRQASVENPIQVRYVPPTRPDENNQLVHGVKPTQAEFTAQAVIDIPSGSMPKYLDPTTGEEFRINKIMYDLEGSPYFLRSFEQRDISDKSKNVFDVVEVNQEILGSFSKADRQFLNSALVPAQNSVPSQQGFSLEEYYKEKGL